MLVQELLELVQLVVGLEEGKAVGFLLRGDFHAAEHEEAVVAPHLLRHFDLTGGVVVGDGNHVQPPRQGALYDGGRAHLQITTGRQHRVNVQIGFERSHLD